jgi:hypothetical protein
MDDDLKKGRGSSCSGSTFGYAVEARCSYIEPRQIGDVLLGTEWKRIPFAAAKCGVPIGAEYEAPTLKMCGLLSYQAAQALRWWFHADAEREPLGGSLCLETRIVKYAIQYSYKTEAVSTHCVIGGEDRSAIMPDWGTKTIEAA